MNHQTSAFQHPNQWHISKAGWFDRIRNSIADWKPEEKLQIDVRATHNRLINMVERREEWGYHPSISALTRRSKEGKIQRDFQLIVWTAIHTNNSSGTIKVPMPLWGWNSAGGKEIPEGKYNLEDIAKVLTSDDTCPGPIPLDIWCDSISHLIPESWLSKIPLNEKDTERLREDIVTFFKSTNMLNIVLPQYASWVCETTKVVIPLAGNIGESLRSVSHIDFPGLVQLDLHEGYILALELLIHESAHLHFFLEEANAGLVDPKHNQLYWSPLKQKPRPLTGIFLAYHALAYISSFYKDAIFNKMVNQDRHRKELERMNNQIEICEQTLESARRYLTDDGNVFLDKTKEVASYLPG